MARLPSDSERVASLRTHVVRSGGTRRPCLRVPDDDHLESALESGACEELGITSGDIIRVVLDRTEYYAPVVSDSKGRLLRGAYRNRRLARTAGDGENELVAWLQDAGQAPGDPILLDVVVPGEVYGLRRPGDRTVYDVTQGPRSSLADIANSLDESEK